MANRTTTSDDTLLRPNMNCPSHQAINILLMGPTGVGKTTFINAFANHLISDNLDDAILNGIKVIIPTSFIFYASDTFEEVSISIGEADQYEQFSTEGQSATQCCRSFLFPIGDRVLRLIDTPGVADTRGIDQDKKNFQEILDFISQYEHLNAIFILLKPNEERLSFGFKYSVNELLRHLHVNAKDNLIFIFTNARSTNYILGNTKRLLDRLFIQHRQEQHVDIPCSRTNTFLVDSESFRYLAVRQKNIDLDDDIVETYLRSWSKAVEEYGRLMDYVITRPLHIVRSMISLNDAEQIIRKLPRPIAQTARLIEENIQLINQYQENVVLDPELALPQNEAIVVSLAHPTTVCGGVDCCVEIEENGVKSIQYIFLCHEECYLKGVPQETIGSYKLQDCSVMNYENGNCNACGCHWRKHLHITYEYKTTRTFLNSRSDIDDRLRGLRAERDTIRNVYSALAKFLQTNSILPMNNDVVEYLNYFIELQGTNRSENGNNADVIAGLEKLKSELIEDMNLFRTTLAEQQTTGQQLTSLTPNDVFDLVHSLYLLPITGEQIRAQVEGIHNGQEQNRVRKEQIIELPAKAGSAEVMKKLTTLLSSTQN